MMDNCIRVSSRRHRSRVASLVLVAAAAAACAADDFWVPEPTGRIRHTFTGDESLVMCLQGRKVVMQVALSAAKGLNCTMRFFHVKEDVFQKAMYQMGPDLDPQLSVDGQRVQLAPPQWAAFDGMLTISYPEVAGVGAVRRLYPSTTQSVVIDQWQLRNNSQRSIKVAVGTSRQEIVGRWRRQVVKRGLVVESMCPGVEPVVVAPGETVSFPRLLQCKIESAPDCHIDVKAEYRARRALHTAAWHGPGRLETPDQMLNLAFVLQKFHALESPIDTCQGTITHNGSLRYSPGVWANDPVEYSSPLFPFLGDRTLNQAGLNMYRIWLNYCREHGFDPFPGSFEHPDLHLVQKHRGDNAMVLYALPMYLMFLGDRQAAEEFWPLIQMSAESVQQHQTNDGIIASRTDEMEGRYPTGSANLSTSSLAYGGYCHAARLARALGKEDEAEEYSRRAANLRKAIGAYFGADVEGFQTYRYFKENRTLRGWILLPLAMGITEREDATVDALVSDKLWPHRREGGDILAESTRETEWARETYYALRVLFKAGRTAEALTLTRAVVKAQVFGNEGPYPDEDAIDMLCPGSLYPRIFIEGTFGITPTGLDSFQCTPWLPEEWPRMALRDLRAFGHAWDLVVERVGGRQQITVTGSDQKVIFRDVGPAGKTYTVSFANTKE